LITYKPATHHHHGGLETLQDVAPKLALRAVEAKWNSRQKAWLASGDSLSVTASLEGLNAPEFSRLPGKLYCFLGDRLVGEQALEGSSMSTTIPLHALEPGVHVLAVNWTTDFGPVSVAAVKLLVGAKQAAR